MIKALALKELREVLGIAFLGLGAHLFLVLCRIGKMPFTPMLPFYDSDIPFLDTKFDKGSCLIAILLAIALGFRQSAWENGRGAYQFLLHRPIRRETIFLTKLMTGLAVFWFCIGGPILLYAVWAAIPGRHPSPFEWSMTAWFWQMCLVTPLFYCGAFLSGLRPAHWFGTRVLPLIAVALPASLLLTMPWPWLLGLPVLLGLYAALISNICYVARMREYS